MSTGDTDERQQEQQLVRRILGGERELFRAVVEQHEGVVYGMIRRQIPDDETARDLTQETFLRAYRGLDGFAGQASLRTWIVRIGLNTAAGYFQSRAFKESAKTSLTDEPPPDATAEPAVEEPYSPHDHARLREALGTLKPIYREAIVLCMLQGLSYQEASIALGVPLGTVCSRLNTGIHQLRLKLRRKP